MPKASNTAMTTINKVSIPYVYPLVKGEVGSPKQTAQKTILQGLHFLNKLHAIDN
jgi:hypothetical protein